MLLTLLGAAVIESVQLTHQTDASSRQPARRADRRRVSVPGRLMWRDARGTLRFASVVTRDVSDDDCFVECQVPAAIPLYRLVHFQVERAARDSADLPAALRDGRVLGAVYRVGPYQSATGTPTGYGLRLLVDPAPRRAVASVESPLLAAAAGN